MLIKGFQFRALGEASELELISTMRLDGSRAIKADFRYEAGWRTPWIALHISISLRYCIK